jgi:hypothetical protein
VAAPFFEGGDTLSSFSLWIQGAVPSSHIGLSGRARQGIADQQSPWCDAMLASARGAEPRPAPDRPGVLLPLTTDVTAHSGW